MSALSLLFRAERIKWRRSWPFLAAFLAPLCLSANLLLILWFSPALVRRFIPGFEFWVELNYMAWNIVFLPILTALVCDLSWQLELEAKTWNHLLIQPVPRRTHFLAKLMSHSALILLAQVLLALLLIPGGFLLRHSLGWLMGEFEPRILLQFALFSTLSSFPLVALHTWLSARLPSLGLALATALCGSWICARFAGHGLLISLAPWGMSSQVLTFFDRWNRHIPWEYFPVALFGAGLVTWLGVLDFTQDREPKY